MNNEPASKNKHESLDWSVQYHHGVLSTNTKGARDAIIWSAYTSIYTHRINVVQVITCTVIESIHL